MKYGYARVSTTDQKLANQIELLKLAGAEKIFQEKFTGTTTERPEFQKLLRVLKTGDTLIVTRTQEGKLYAKQHDPSFREGRPKTYSDEQIRFAYELRKQGMTYKMIERKTGISKHTQQRRFKLIEKDSF